MASGSRHGAGAGGGKQQELDPKYEWQETATNFVLRLHLSGFRKEDFRVQVDGAGRLTVRGQQPSSSTRFNKVFQLPATSNLDAISGRFDAGVLTLTVPKRPSTGSVVDEEQETKKQQHHESKPHKEPERSTGKPKDQPKETAEAKPGTGKHPEQQRTTAAAPPPAAAAAVGKEEEANNNSNNNRPKPEPPAAAVPDDKTKQPAPAAATPKPPPLPADSLAERVKRRRAEEEEAEERQVNKAPRDWIKPRVADDLDAHAASDWAEGLVHAVRNNKEVIAAAVAAFSLGLFVSSRLFSRN